MLQYSLIVILHFCSNEELLVLNDMIKRIISSLQSVLKDQFNVNIEDDLMIATNLTEETSIVSKVLLSLLEENGVNILTWSHFLTSLHSASEMALECDGTKKEQLMTAKVILSEGLVCMLAPLSVVDPLIIENSTNEQLEQLVSSGSFTVYYICKALVLYIELSLLCCNCIAIHYYLIKLYGISSFSLTVQISMSNVFIHSFQSYMNQMTGGDGSDQVNTNQLETSYHSYVASTVKSASYWTEALSKRQSTHKRFQTEKVC